MKYLSPKQLGQAIGVSESSLKRWIDDGLIDVIRTTGGHRRVELAEAIRFVRLRGYTVKDPSVLGLTAADDETGRAGNTQLSEHFYDLLTNGRDKEFVAAVTRLYLDGHAISEIIDGPIRESMNQIGELWHGNPDGVGIEHRATDICIRTLGYMHSLIRPAAPNAPVAIGGAPAGDMHLISSLCVSLVLAEQGWREMNLGANTPWDQLFSVAKQEQASLVWVSMTAEPNADYAKKLHELADELAAESCQIIVGGRQLNDAILRLGLDNLHTARSMAELQSFSKGLLAAQKAMHPANASATSSHSGTEQQA
ncbi:MAG: cobalamin-dependent protein [Phycisphaeraceae bacterium]|nr:cobalamin-dependent protein [Phycisphaeraceae bacterium]